MIGLETERLTIRNFILDDYKDLAKIGMRYEETELAKYDEGPWPSDPEEYKGIVAEFVKTDDFLAVEHKESRKLIGLIFKGSKEEGKYEFGYNFHTDYHGKGYATESCKIVLDYLFEVLKAKTITAGTAKINAPSNKLLKRLGFEFVEEKKQAFRKYEKGNPIEFVGLDYILIRKD